MKIKLKVPLSGPAGSFSIGDEVEWEDDDAARLIAAGYAEAVEADDARVDSPKRGARTAALKGGKEKR